MNDVHDETLKRYHDPFNQDHPRLRQAILEKLATEPADTASSPRRAPVALGSALALAACVMLAVLAWGLFIAQPSTLHAQVVAALDGAQTVHMHAEQFEDDELQKTIERWYLRGQGYAERRTLGDQIEWMVEGRQHAWAWTEGEQPVARFTSYRSVDEPASFNLDIALARLVDLLQFGPEREPEGDRDIEGSPTRKFTMDYEGDRQEVWIDNAGQIRAFVHRYTLPHGSRIEVRGLARFNQPIDPARFDPPPGEVVDAMTYVRGLFPLDDVVHRHERVGLVFAVHRLDRIDERHALMVSSTRLVDPARQAIAPADPRRYFGEATLMPDWGNREDRPVTLPIRLASLHVADLHVKWHLVQAQDAALESANLLIAASAANELDQWLVLNDQDTRDQTQLTIPVDPDDPAIDLHDELARLHQRATWLQPMVNGFQLHETRVREGGGTVSVGRNPRQLSVQQFIDEVMAHMRD